ncbi:MAG: flagellar biosynthesis anti-sigma factor FlgM [Bacteriovorax sp.]|nr:flagellar biosynthesis anti-sigma factor FlgM [Bacteriovorax sp.]
MSAVDSTSSRSLFMPGKKETRESGKVGPAGLKRNSETRKNELEAFSKSDSKVDIADAIKDFARIKKVADAAPDIDNTDKIARLKAQIADGSYKIDLDGLSDKILEQEF